MNVLNAYLHFPVLVQSCPYLHPLRGGIIISFLVHQAYVFLSDGKSFCSSSSCFRAIFPFLHEQLATSGQFQTVVSQLYSSVPCQSCSTRIIYQNIEVLPVSYPITCTVRCFFNTHLTQAQHSLNSFYVCNHSSAAFGTWSSVIQLIHFNHAHLHFLQWTLHDQWNFAQNLLDAPITISSSLINDLLWWLNKIHISADVSLPPLCLYLHLFMDTSFQGWGV